MRVDDVVGEAEGYVTILCVLRKPVGFETCGGGTVG